MLTQLTSITSKATAVGIGVATYLAAMLPDSVGIDRNLLEVLIPVVGFAWWLSSELKGLKDDVKQHSEDVRALRNELDSRPCALCSREDWIEQFSRRKDQGE